MQFDWIQFLSATMVMFAVIDIVGSIPLILDIKSKAGDVQPLRATLVAFGIMIAFLFIGERIIGLLGIDVNSFAVAGSFVLFILALEMILGIELFKHEEQSRDVASIVPIAFPIVAGAGSMTSILSLRAEYEQINIAAAIFINLVLVYIVLRATGKIGRFLGDGGVLILKKVFGIVLLAIAVKLFSENAKLLLQ
jgi:multiple antibiotic resistance protein